MNVEMRPYLTLSISRWKAWPPPEMASISDNYNMHTYNAVSEHVFAAWLMDIYNMIKVPEVMGATPASTSGDSHERRGDLVDVKLPKLAAAHHRSLPSNMASEANSNQPACLPECGTKSCTQGHSRITSNTLSHSDLLEGVCSSGSPVSFGCRTPSLTQVFLEKPSFEPPFSYCRHLD